MNNDAIRYVIQECGIMNQYSWNLNPVFMFDETHKLPATSFLCA